jgi:hypothetical protein
VKNAKKSNRSENFADKKLKCDKTGRIKIANVENFSIKNLSTVKFI